MNDAEADLKRADPAERVGILKAALEEHTQYFDRIADVLNMRVELDKALQCVSGEHVPATVTTKQLAAAIKKLGGDSKPDESRVRLLAKVAELKAARVAELRASAPRRMVEGPLALTRFSSTEPMERGSMLEERVRNAVPPLMRKVGKALGGGVDGDEDDPDADVNAGPVNPFAFTSEPQHFGMWRHKMYGVCAASLDGNFAFSHEEKPESVEDLAVAFVEIKVVQGAAALAESVSLAREARYVRVSLEWRF